MHSLSLVFLAICALHMHTSYGYDEIGTQVQSEFAVASYGAGDVQQAAVHRPELATVVLTASELEAVDASHLTNDQLMAELAKRMDPTWTTSDEVNKSQATTEVEISNDVSHSNENKSVQVATGNQGGESNATKENASRGDLVGAASQKLEESLNFTEEAKLAMASLDQAVHNGNFVDAAAEALKAHEMTNAAAKSMNDAAEEVDIVRWNLGTKHDYATSEEELSAFPRVFHCCGTMVAGAWLYLLLGQLCYGRSANIEYTAVGQQGTWSPWWLWLAAPIYWVVMPITLSWLGFGATCEGGSPLVAYLVYAAFLTFHAGVAAYSSYNLGPPDVFTWSITKSLPFLAVMTVLEHSDLATDVMFAGSAEACSSAITAQWLHSWHEVPLIGHGVAKVFARMHFSGVSLALFVVAAYLPQLLGIWSSLTVLVSPILFAMVLVWVSFDWYVGLPLFVIPYGLLFYFVGRIQWDVLMNDHLSKPSTLGVYCGMMILEPNAQDAGGDSDYRALYLFLTRLLFENIIQLWLQTSYFSLSFDLLSDQGKAKILLSIGLGLLVASSKLVQVVFPWYRWMRYNWWYQDSDAFGAWMGLILITASALMILLIVAKICYTFTCPDHMWNLTSGCVESSI